MIESRRSLLQQTSRRPFDFLDKMAGPEHARTGFTIGTGIALAGLASSVGSKIAKGASGGGAFAAMPPGGFGGSGSAPQFGEGEYFGPMQKNILAGMPDAYTRQRELDFGRAAFGGEALGSMRGALPGFMPAPGEDVFRGQFYNAGQDIDALGRARDALGTSIDRYGALGGRALGTEMAARPLVEQGLASPFALGPESEALFGQRWGLQRNLLLAEQAQQAGALRERLAGRFGPGYESGTPFLAEEEGYVTRPYVEGLTKLGIGDIESRLGAAQWQRGYERDILGDAVRSQLQAGQLSDVAAGRLATSGEKMAALRAEDARKRMSFLQQVQKETPNLMASPLGALRDIRTIQGGGGGGGGPAFSTQPGGPGMIGGMMGEIGGAGMQFGARMMGEKAADERQRRALEAQYGRQAVGTTGGYSGYMPQLSSFSEWGGGGGGGGGGTITGLEFGGG